MQITVHCLFSLLFNPGNGGAILHRSVGELHYYTAEYTTVLSLVAGVVSLGSNPAAEALEVILKEIQGQSYPAVAPEEKVPKAIN
jgi:hypothetical protein